MSSISKTPPSLSGSKSYDDWVNLVNNWRKFPSLEPEKQEPVIVLSLEGESQDGVLELDSDIISGKDGVDKVIARLNKVYKKDELTQKCNAFESFEKYKRQSNTTIRNFLTEFEKRFHKTISYGTVT